MKLCDELMPVLHELQSKGIEVYTYTVQNNYRKEYLSLYWFQNDRGRILNIQPNIFRDEQYSRDRFNLSVSYIPGSSGSGCSLSPDSDGVPASKLLQYSNAPTWVTGIRNYSSMENFLKNEHVLRFFKLNENGEQS